MSHLIFSDNSFLTFYPKLAEFLGTTQKKNLITVPPAVGKGYMEMIALGDDIYASVEDYTFQKDVQFSRRKVKDPFFILIFDEMKTNKNYEVRMDGELMKAKAHTITGAMLTCSLFDLSYVLPANTHKRSIIVMLTKEWMIKYMNLGVKNEEVCNNYFSLKVQHLNQEPFNAEYRRYFNHVFDLPKEKPLRELHIRNAIMMLMEVFFVRLHKKTMALKNTPARKMNVHDLYKLMEVEHMLVQDFSKAPPTIVDLAAYTSMSVSKLKSVFKQVYGSGIYEYYQKNRMQKARTMLLTQSHTVKEVGLQLGYSNLSNFSLAFKKEFGILPSEL
ncbi:MAG TPA: helix-turn-helix transcriptional regulator [Lacibacter sp.]|nr:helix-turn-helix transcriptional regulator [Lacibacter sp.]